MFIAGYSTVLVIIYTIILGTSIVSMVWLISEGFTSSESQVRDTYLLILSFLFIISFLYSAINMTNPRYHEGKNLVSVVTEDGTKSVTYNSEFLNCWEMKNQILCERKWVY